MDDYYMQQSGSGIGYYSGARYQKGNGFMGRFISGSVMPLIRKVLPFLGKSVLNAGVDVMNDWSKGENLKDSLSKRAQETGNKIQETAEAKVREITGSGLSRKRESASVQQVYPTSNPSKKAKKNIPQSNKSRCKKSKRASRKALDFL